MANDDYKAQRKAAYEAAGLTIENLTVAIWESLTEEGYQTLNSMQEVRKQIKEQFPKPN